MPVYLWTEHRDKTFGSVLLLRNDGKGNFEGILLEEETCNHASCLLHDVDRDGDIDLLVSNFLSETDETMNPISLWENQSANSSTVMATPAPAIE